MEIVSLTDNVQQEKLKLKDFVFIIRAKSIYQLARKTNSEVLFSGFRWLFRVSFLLLFYVNVSNQSA